MMDRPHRPVLRQATIADSKFCYDVKKAAFREYVEQIWGWDEAYQRRVHARHFDASSIEIITYEGRDAGWLEVRHGTEATLIANIYVYPEYQNRGIGTRLLEKVLREAEQNDVPVKLGVLKVNARARQLYERLGFRVVSETDTHYLMEVSPPRGPGPGQSV